MPADTPDAVLAWENRVVLSAVQALLGLVSPEMLGVAVEIDGEHITLHFALSHGASDELNEDISDVVAEVEGLLWPDTPDVDSRVHFGDAKGAWDGRQHRLVLPAKGHGV